MSKIYAKRHEPGDDELAKEIHEFADFISGPYLHGEETEEAENIVVKLMRRFGVEPFDIKYELRTKNSRGNDI